MKWHLLSRMSITAARPSWAGPAPDHRYGTLYYSFSILAPEMAKVINWTQKWVFGVFSATIDRRVAARLLDRRASTVMARVR